MKKLTAVLLSVMIAAISFVGAMAADENVQISFRVGESTLQINGNAVEVETPYVVGEGTTLVPLRVISEAFGAEVVWNGEDKSVTLTYNNDNIRLQIDNKTAVVNGTDTALAEAPQLTENGFTMVPLRFISENFGATVGYDDATRAITVTKEKVKEQTTVAGEDEKNSSESASSSINLSETDAGKIKNSYADLRYNFEQFALPSAFFENDALTITNQEEFKARIIESWDMISFSLVFSVLIESDTEYVIASEEDAKALNAFIEECGLSAEDNIEKIDFIDDNGTTIAVLTMKDCEELLISKYIGITCDKDGNFRYFTLEKSFGDLYMFCEITAQSRGNYGSIDCEYNSFADAIKEVIKK